MTLHRDRGTQFIECDICGEQIERGSDTMHFDEWIDALKHEGWRFTKHKNEWEHQCPSCAEEDD